jgi:stress response protein SCP2
MCKYELDEDFSIETAIEFGRLYKRGGNWRFEAMGAGASGGLQTFVNKYAAKFTSPASLMAISLSKGQTISLNKDDHDLSSITIGLGWKIQQRKTNMLGALFGGGKSKDFDLDAIAFLLDENDKLATRGDERLVGGDVVFFNSLRHPTGAVYHSGDNRVGGSGARDDEQIVVKLNALDGRYHKILFLVCIYQGQQNQQHFGAVENAYIRALDANDKEIARYGLGADASYQGKCTMVFGEVYRHGSGWKFRAVGDAHPFDSFIPLLKQHLP